MISMLKECTPCAMLAPLGTMVKITESSILLFLMSIVGLLIHTFAIACFGCWGKFKSFHIWRVNCCFASMKFACCPKRKLRWEMCKRRRLCRWRGGNGNGDDEDREFSICAMRCPLQRAAAFYKLHLPPPLPLQKERRSKRTKLTKPLESSPTVASPLKKSTANLLTMPTPDVEELHSDKIHVRRQRRASLIDLARMQQWKAILSQPLRRRDAKQRDADGLYPLHWAVSGGPPVEVVRALLQAYPPAAYKRDSEGSTPLHFASCYSASKDVHVALLNVYPKAASEADRYGRVPLYHAVEKSAGLSVLSTLIQAAPEMILRPCKSVPSDKVDRTMATRTPLFIAWANIDRHAKIKFKGKQWDKATRLLEAAYLQEKQMKSTADHHLATEYNLLSAVLALDMYLPTPVLDLVLASNPDAVSLRDSASGKLPLHVAAAAPTYSATRSHALILRVLEHFPSAACGRDINASSPLGIALHSGKPWNSIEVLLQAAPQALNWRETTTGLPPPLIAACADARSDYDDVLSDAKPKDNDPCGLLTRKQQELLGERGGSFSTHGDGTSKADISPYQDDETCLDHEHASTLYRILLLHPSLVVSACSAAGQSEG